MLDAIHASQLAEHGGASGVRDEGLVEASLARPRHKWAYAAKADLPLLAASYAFGLARNHGFVDGNKRTAFVTAGVFLLINDTRLAADEADVVQVMQGVATGDVTEPTLARWIRAHLAI